MQLCIIEYLFSEVLLGISYVQETFNECLALLLGLLTQTWVIITLATVRHPLTVLLTHTSSEQSPVFLLQAWQMSPWLPYKRACDWPWRLKTQWFETGVFFSCIIMNWSANESISAPKGDNFCSLLNPLLYRYHPWDGRVTDLIEKFGETMHALFSSSIVLGEWIALGWWGGGLQGLVGEACRF